jgi:hypothetical protein
MTACTHCFDSNRTAHGGYFDVSKRPELGTDFAARENNVEPPLREDYVARELDEQAAFEATSFNIRC